MVDDASADGCQPVLETFDDARLSLVVHDRPRGAAEARNTGIRQARGTWIAFLDDDDIWAPDHVAASLAALGDDRRSAWCCVGTIHIDRHWRVVGGSQPPDPGPLAADLRWWNMIPTTSCVVASATLLDDAGPFDPAFPLFQDWDYWLRAAQLAPLATVARPLTAYRWHGGNMTNDAQRWEAEISLLHEKHGIGAEPAPAYAPSRDRATAWNYLQAGLRQDSVRAMWKVARRHRDWRAAVCTAAIAVAPGAMVRADAARRRRQVPPGWVREAEAWLDPLRSVRTRG